MSGMSNLALQLRDEGGGSGSLEEIAVALGGEVEGRFIRCPSPGRPANDRSCHVRVDPSRPNDFFIYDCDGPKGRAYENVRSRLRLVDHVRAPTQPRFEQVLRIQAETAPASGTLVERYLRSRAITVPPPPCLRFHPALYHRPSGLRWPAMVSTRTGRYGEISSIHRTFLSRDGRGKAPVEPQRMDLGPAREGAIRLTPFTDELLIGEGIETTLSAMQATQLPGWAAGSAIALRNLALPDAAKNIILLVDGDDAGRAAAHAASKRWLEEGRRVRIAQAPPGKDFNDLLAEGSRT